MTDAIYYTGISIVNYNSARRAQSDPPLTPGVSILSHREEINYATGNEQLVLEHAPIDLATVTWPLILELRYDDTCGDGDGGYSLTAARPSRPVHRAPAGSRCQRVTVSPRGGRQRGRVPRRRGDPEATLSRLEQPGRGGLRMRTTLAATSGATSRCESSSPTRARGARRV